MEEKVLYQVRDEGDLRKYYTTIPNIIDDMDLSVYAYRLYGHLKRVAGDVGQCWQSTETLAKACGMGWATVSRAKTELVGKELIIIEQVKNPQGGKDFHNITITDVWENNTIKYATSTQEGETSHQEITTSHQEIKNNPIKNKPNNNAGRPALSEGQSYLLQSLGGKRLNPKQRDTILELERTYGTDRLKEVIDWAADRGMAVGVAVPAIKTAIPKWGRTRPPTNGSKPAAQENAFDRMRREMDAAQ